ncbi:MAG: cyclic nucleotide-binding domain-containing protein [Oscillospiraceae bacterium]|nr:cyclic nucleotide-binding domain-containing protein [Oscillospiraceae bacterium]
MSANEYKEGSIIYGKGDTLTHIALIAEGEVEGVFGGHTFLYGKTDVIGLCDITSDVHSHTYTALSDVTLHPFPCDGVSSLDSLMQKNADIAYLMVNSMCKQISELMRYKTRLKMDTDGAFDMVNNLYAEYSRLCKTYASTPKKLPGLEDIEPFSGHDPIEDWVQEFYNEITFLNPATHKAFFHGNPGIETGFLRRCVADVSQILHACTMYHEYLDGIYSLLLNDNGYDMLSLICELHLSSVKIEGADDEIDPVMAQLTETLSDMTGINSDYYQSRLDSYWDMLEESRNKQDYTYTAPIEQGMNQNLVDSLLAIIEYSECDEDIAGIFTECVTKYTELTDRNSSDDDVPELRRTLTKTYYVVHKHVFLKYLKDPSPPTVIKMFLNFGYVDATLAGYENANFLYSIADTYKGDPENNIFTISEWLTSIYNGDRNPSLSEFDMDFTAYCRDLKNQKQIDAREEARLLADRDEHLKYEMENAFPVVNRVTFGNPSRFCPVYSSHNVMRSPEDTLVTAAKVKEIIDEIRALDFSAFYRETAYSNPKIGISAETVNVEVIPNFILMPNVGIRGSMWQEIEGRIRTTPARIFMPIFLEGDLKPLVIKLVGEFRWEMCRRIQGSRWNDLTDPSLTSYFCDYLQFYMNNRSIAMQTMTEIRNELSAARNNYKTVFVQNYLVWILNESRGMARLNSIALGILMTFCPFNAQVRESLSKNMRYNEALNRFNAKRQKRAQRLTLLIKKLQQSGKGIPKEMMDEYEYAKR